MRVALLVLPLLLAGCASPYNRAPDRITEDTVDLAEESYRTLGVAAGGSVHVRVRFTVTDGGSIDAWIATGADCQGLGLPTFDPGRAVLDDREGSLEVDLEEDFCLVLENATDNHEGARARGNVTVAYAVELWNRG